MQRVTSHACIFSMRLLVLQLMTIKNNQNCIICAYSKMICQTQCFFVECLNHFRTYWMDFGKSLCSVMSHVVLFAYQTGLNILRGKRFRSMLQKKLYLYCHFRRSQQCHKHNLEQILVSRALQCLLFRETLSLVSFVNITLKEEKNNYFRRERTLRVCY